MKANPGGAVSPENVMGRDHLIDRLWATLKHQSLVLVAERRMGKTCIIKKMEAQPPDETMSRVRDVGGVSSPIDAAHWIGVTPWRRIISRTSTTAWAIWVVKGRPVSPA